MTLFTAKLMEYVFGVPYLKTHKMTSQKDATSDKTAADPEHIDQLIGNVLEYIIILRYNTSRTRFFFQNVCMDFSQTKNTRVFVPQYVPNSIIRVKFVVFV